MFLSVSQSATYVLLVQRRRQVMNSNRYQQSLALSPGMYVPVRPYIMDPCLLPVRCFLQRPRHLLPVAWVPRRTLVTRHQVPSYFYRRRLEIFISFACFFGVVVSFLSWSCYNFILLVPSKTPRIFSQ